MTLTEDQAVQLLTEEERRRFVLMPLGYQWPLQIIATERKARREAEAELARIKEVLDYRLIEAGERIRSIEAELDAERALGDELAAEVSSIGCLCGDCRGCLALEAHRRARGGE